MTWAGPAGKAAGASLSFLEKILFRDRMLPEEPLGCTPTPGPISPASRGGRRCGPTTSRATRSPLPAASASRAFGRRSGLPQRSPPRAQGGRQPRLPGAAEWGLQGHRLSRRSRGSVSLRCPQATSRVPPPPVCVGPAGPEVSVPPGSGGVSLLVFPID